MLLIATVLVLWPLLGPQSTSQHWGKVINQGDTNPRQEDMSQMSMGSNPSAPKQFFGIKVLKELATELLLNEFKTTSGNFN